MGEALAATTFSGSGDTENEGALPTTSALPAASASTSSSTNPSTSQSSSLTAARNSAVSTEEQPPVSFYQSKSLTTVQELIREYEHGLNGDHSVKTLEEEWGRRWREHNTVTKFYTRCKPVYDEYERLRAAGKSEAQAVKVLEDLRIQHKESLSKFKDRCKAMVSSE